MAKRTPLCSHSVHGKDMKWSSLVPHALQFPAERFKSCGILCCVNWVIIVDGW
jgi:hypothetical protein